VICIAGGIANLTAAAPTERASDRNRAAAGALDKLCPMDGSMVAAALGRCDSYRERAVHCCAVTLHCTDLS